MARFVRFYGSAYNKWPYSIAFITCYIKVSIADCVTQSKVENYQRSKEKIDDDNEGYWFNKIDWKRNAKFAFWSGLYCGSIQHYFYNILYPSIFIGNSLKMSLYKSMTDSFITAPFVGMTFYYGCKSFLSGQSFKEGMQNYRDEFWNVMSAYWKIWLPVITLVMFVVPVPFRIITIGSVSLLWLMILSHLSPCIENEESIRVKAEESEQMALILETNKSIT